MADLDHLLKMVRSDFYRPCDRPVLTVIASKKSSGFVEPVCRVAPAVERLCGLTQCLTGNRQLIHDLVLDRACKLVEELSHDQPDVVPELLLPPFLPQEQHLLLLFQVGGQIIAAVPRVLPELDTELAREPADGLGQLPRRTADLLA